MKPKALILSGKLLVLKQFRLGHTPPAEYSTEILSEKNIPLVVIEYGYQSPQRKFHRRPFLKIRLETFPLRLKPRFLDSAFCFLVNLAQLAGWIIRRGKPHFIAAHGLNESTVAYLLSRIFNIPYAYHVHEVYEPASIGGFNRLLLLLEKKVLERATFLIFPEKTRAEIYRKRYSLKSSPFIVANCPRHQPLPSAIRLREKYRLPPRAFLVGYLGGIGEANGIYEMVRAFRDLTDPDICFLIFGFGSPDYSQRLQRAITDWKLQDRVKLIGEVSDKLGHLQGLDLSFCYYHVTELRTAHILTASNKFMESLCAQVPVLTSASEEFTSFLAQYPVGLSLPDLSPGTIAEAILFLKNNPEFRSQAASIARNLHHQIYNYDLQFRDALSRYQKEVPSVNYQEKTTEKAI